MNIKNNSKYSMLLAASAVTLALSGCGGSDGSDGDDGQPGAPGGPAAQAINTLNLELSSVAYTDGAPTINIFATNQDDEAVVGLTDLSVRVAQLSPIGATGAGEGAQWNAISLRSDPATFVDNKNGSYTATIPVEGYNQELTQRFNVYAGGADSTLADGVTSVPRREIIADFSGDGYQPLYTKNMVSHQVCANCHAEGQPLTRRHSSYQTVETCITCHNADFDTDTQWRHLVHNIHNANKSFTDSKGNEFTGEKAEFLLQNNCQTCHVASDTLTEWADYARVPTMETCSSCHTDVNFKAGEGHPQQSDNSNCIACHNSEWTTEVHSEEAVSTKAIIDQYGLSAELVGNADNTATLTISVLDSAGVAIDINSVMGHIQRVEATTNIGPNFPQMSYADHDSVNLIENGVLLDTAVVVDGKLVRTTPVLPFGLGDTDTAFSFVGFSVCVDNNQAADCAADGSSKYTGMKAELAFGTKSGDAPSTRHTDSVNFDACENCHGETFAIHENDHHPGFVITEQLGREVNGTLVTGVDGCVACHTPDGTYAGGANKGALEMKVHTTHIAKAALLLRGDCGACHSSFNLDAFANKKSLATGAGTYTTPIAATCSSCHPIGVDGMHDKAFVENVGAAVDVSKEEADQTAASETCLFCHKPTVDDHTQTAF